MLGDCGTEDNFSLRNVCILNNNPTDKDSLFSELYKYIYGICDKNEVKRHILGLRGNVGFCTTKWLEETVAFKCYDCESDSTCAICLDCFFNSNHKGHEYRLTRTSGGCCDCGDSCSWDPKGSCYKHHGYMQWEDEKATLNCFKPTFLSRLENLLSQIIEYISDYLKNLDPVDEIFVHILLSFLHDLVKTTPAYRYVACFVIGDDVLVNWISKHQTLSSELQKAFNSLYLTMLISMSFKRKFAAVFVKLYNKIVQPLKEFPDDWHLSNLSVQLFTYSDIAFELVNGGFLDVCLGPILDEGLVDRCFKTIQFTRFDRKRFSLYIRILSDLTYLINHQSVCKLILADKNLQLTLFNLLMALQNMNTIEREDEEHVTFENTGYSVAFPVEHTLLLSLRPIADYCKGLKESQNSQLIEFYMNLNEFIKKNISTIKSFGQGKLLRSFHIPLVRFFATVVNTNYLRETVKTFIGDLAKNNQAVDKYVRESFPSLRGDGFVSMDMINVFDNDVLVYIFQSVARVMRFSMEIKQNYWVYNGESMHDQRSNYYEFGFDSLDTAALQISAILLGLKQMGGQSDVQVLKLLFSESFAIEISDISGLIEDVFFSLDTNASSPEKTVEGNFRGAEIGIPTLLDKFDPKIPGDCHFKIVSYYYFLHILIMDVKHLEVLSIPRKVMKEDFVRRGYPLVMMDVINALALGNLEFSHVVKEAEKHWKHHPKLIEAIEQVASVNCSKVSDKAYIRLKTESYRMFDILWNPSAPISHQASIDEALKRSDISLLGMGRNETKMSKEYTETQDIILSCLSGHHCFIMIMILFLKLSGDTDFDIDDLCKQYPTLADIADKESGNMNFQRGSLKFESQIVCVDGKWNECIMYCLKIFNLMTDVLPPMNRNSAERIVELLNSVYNKLDDAVCKTSLRYTLKRLSDAYSLKTLENTGPSETEARHVSDIKKLQSRFMKRLLSQQMTFIKEIPGLEHSPSEISETELCCILCKQNMDEDNPISYMCFISTNNVLRRCCYSISLNVEGENETYNVFSDYDINVKSSLPLKSSMITSCGHIAHAKCVSEHRKSQSETQVLAMYGIYKSSDEFFCPMCKSLCNYTLDYTPALINQDECAYKMSLWQDNDGVSLKCDEQSSSSKSTDRTKVGTVDKVGKNPKLHRLCKSSWRYPYSTNWIPSPVYARFEQHPYLVYALNSLLSSDHLNLDFSMHPKSFVDDILPIKDCKNMKVGDNKIQCRDCLNMDCIKYTLGTTGCKSLCNKGKTSVLDRHDAIKYFKDPKLISKRLHNWVVDHWEIGRLTPMVKIMQLSQNNEPCIEYFPRIVTLSYCKSIFSCQRTFFGVQNWRNVNAGVKIDPKFWLVYNEVLATCCLRRNSLITPNALFFQLIRFLYHNRLDNSHDYQSCGPGGVLDRVIRLDESYFDVSPLNMSFPGTAEAYEVNNDTEMSTIDLFVQTLDDAQLSLLDDALRAHENRNHDIRTAVDRENTSNFCLSEANVSPDDFLRSSVDGSTDNFMSPESIGCVDFVAEPVLSGSYFDFIEKIAAKKINKEKIYEIFGVDLAPSPWSVDLIRDFLLYFLSGENKNLEEVRTQIYYYLVLGTLEVLDRFAIECVRDSYRRYIDEAAANPNAAELYIATRNKRDFLFAFFSRHFKDPITSGEFPVNIMQRLSWIDFEEHKSLFRQFNGFCGAGEYNDTVTEMINSCHLYDKTSHTLSEMIHTASKMRNVHQKTVAAFTEPVPTTYSISELEKRGDDSEELINYHVDEFLQLQVQRLLKVRQIHYFIHREHKDDELKKLVDYIKLSTSTKRAKTNGMNTENESDGLNNIFVDSIPLSSIKYLGDKQEENRSYRSTDFVKRVYAELFQNHCHVAFFEVLKGHIPNSYHILDFLSLNVLGDIQLLRNKLNESINTSERHCFCGYQSLMRYIFDVVFSDLKRLGYLNVDFNADFTLFKGMVENHLNLFLDICFWTIASIIPVDKNLITKISYSHLHNSSTRFNMLLEALELGDDICTVETTWNIWSRLFSKCYRQQLELSRICNIEITPPLISNYAFISFDKFLKENSWDLIRSVSRRHCANCGLRPANPIVCLLCGSIICSNSDCCYKVKSPRVSRFFSLLERGNINYRSSDIMHVYSEEMIAHANYCGGGQTIYVSPYYCCTLYVDERRRCVSQSLFTDNYGNSDFHGKVYGVVSLSKTRLANITNTFCSGRLSNDIVSIRKQFFNHFN